MSILLFVFLLFELLISSYLKSAVHVFCFTHYSSLLFPFLSPSLVSCPIHSSIFLALLLSLLVTSFLIPFPYYPILLSYPILSPFYLFRLHFYPSYHLHSPAFPFDSSPQLSSLILLLHSVSSPSSLSYPSLLRPTLSSPFPVLPSPIFFFLPLLIPFFSLPSLFTLLGILNQDELAAEVRKARTRDRARTMELMELEAQREGRE